MSNPPKPENRKRFDLGDRVVKTIGEQTYEGVVVSRFWRKDGVNQRYVVEADDGRLSIFAPHQLELVAEESPLDVLDQLVKWANRINREFGREFGK